MPSASPEPTTLDGDAHTWFVAQLRAAGGSPLAPLVADLAFGAPFSWLPTGSDLAAEYPHDVDGTGELLELAALGIADLLATRPTGAATIPALLLEDGAGLRGPDGFLPWPNWYSAAVLDSLFHIAEGADPDAVRDAINSRLAPWGNVGVLVDLPRPDRFRGYRTPPELAAVVQTATHVVTEGWNGQGLVVAPIQR